MMLLFANNDRPLQRNIKTRLMTAALAMLINLVLISEVKPSIIKPDSSKKETTLQEKVATYKMFKKEYEDKDFHVKSSTVIRTEHINGKSRVYSFNIYNITYGLIEDNMKEYDKRRKKIVRNPTKIGHTQESTCPSRLYFEDYNESIMQPKAICLEEAEQSYPIALIFSALPKEELKYVAVIYEFNDGDVDIRFTLEKESDEKFVKKLFRKLRESDEKNDEKKPEVKMEPILPAKNQKITIAYIDEDKDGEADFVLIPYCIDGSYFDKDPGNDTVQVGLKYKLVTRKDLRGKTGKERQLLEKRLGLWMWDNPVEILTSFSEHPGPDIVFYDLGKVVNKIVIDSKPDGKFDKYEFLY